MGAREPFSCGEIYAALDRGVALGAAATVPDLFKLAFDGAWQTSGYLPVSGVKFGDPAPTKEAAHTAARSRLAHEVKLLRVVTDLTKRLVEANLKADMAGAAEQAARAADTRMAAELRWGARDPYDSLAHVGRTLSGRLEVGSTPAGLLAADPSCSGVKGLDLVARAYVGGVAARIEDPPIGSEGELLAVQIASQLGVVVDRSRIDASSLGDAKLREVVLAQLNAAEAARSSSTVAAVSAGPRAARWSAQLATLSAAQILVGLEHAWATARLRLGVSSEELSAAATEVGVARAGAGGEPLVVAFSGAGAVALRDHVLTRGDVLRSGIARTAGLASAAACTEPAGVAQAFGITAPAAGAEDGSTWTEASFNRVPRWATQDPFSLAQFVERRVTVIGARAMEARPNEVDVRAEAARVAVTLRTWAGPARVFVRGQTDSPALDPTLQKDGGDTIVLELHGARPADLGLDADTIPANDSRALGSLRLVFGYPYDAECAVSGAASCPGLPTARAPIAAAAFAHVRDGAVPVASTLGVYDVLRWTFKLDAVKSAFVGAAEAARAMPLGKPNAKRLYVIGPDPTSAGRAAILGAVPMPHLEERQTTDTGASVSMPRRWVVSFPISPMQRTALESTMSLPAQAVTPQVSVVSAGAAGSSCSAELTSTFVPLENEMILGPGPSEDSWRTWLDRAKVAAEEADAIGRELISHKLTIENRRETAAQRLASLCGTTAAVSRMKVVNNTLDVSGDPALSACLGQQAIDVVTFGPAPSTPAERAAVSARVQVDLDCALTGARSARCNRLAQGRATFGSLFLANGRLREAPPMPSCGSGRAPIAGSGVAVPTGMGRVTRAFVPRPLSQYMEDVLRSGGNGFDAAAFLRDGRALGYAGDSVFANLRRARLRVEFDASWTVSVGANEVALATTVPSAFTGRKPWPACLRDETCFGESRLRDHAMRALNTAFRRCTDGEPALDRSLAACEGIPANPAPAIWAAFTNDVLWRLEGALWLGDVISGEVPRGAFDIPVPLRNKSNRYWPTPLPGGDWREDRVLRTTGADNTIDTNPFQTYDFRQAMNGFDYATSTPDKDPFNPPTPPAAPSWSGGGALSANGLDRTQDAFFYRWSLTQNKSWAEQIYPAWFTKVYPRVEYYRSLPSDWGSRYLHARGSNAAYGATALRTFTAGVTLNGFGAGLDARSYEDLVAFLGSKNAARWEWAYPVSELKRGASSGSVAGGFEYTDRADPLVWMPRVVERGMPGGWNKEAEWQPSQPADRALLGSGCVRGECRSPINEMQWVTSAIEPFKDTSHWPGMFYRDLPMLLVRPGSSSRPVAQAVASRLVTRFDFDAPRVALKRGEYLADWCNQALSATPNEMRLDGVRGSGCTLVPDQTLGLEHRVRAFVNSSTVLDSYEAAQEFLGAHALACAIPSSRSTAVQSAPPSPPPPATTIDGALDGMATYSQQIAAFSDASLSDLYLVGVPSLVADRQDSNPVGALGVISDEASAARANIIEIREAVASINDVVAGLADAIDDTRIAYATAKLRGEIQSKNLHLQKLKVLEEQLLAPIQAAKELSKVGSGLDWYNPASWLKLASTGPLLAELAVRERFASLEAGVLDDLSMLQSQEADLEATKVLRGLYVQGREASQRVRSILASIRTKQLELQGHLARFQGMQAEAREAAGIASGARAIEDEGGVVRPIPLNVVNDRLSEGNERRYREALERARTYAVYARRAFEQKIGIPLDQIRQPVGGIQPPAAWVDSVCRTTGVDYESLRSITDADGGTATQATESAPVGAYADVWVGDYVKRLAAFEDAFLVRFPFTSGEDVALLSMREQLLTTTDGCTAPTRNRLAFSGDLERMSSPIGGSAAVPVAGWQAHPCASSATTCVVAQSGSLIGTLPAAAASVAAPSRDDVSWLRDAARSAFNATPGVSAEWDADWISQATAVEAGTHRLTWSDGALDANGNALGAAATGVRYEIAIFGATGWQPLARTTFDPTGTWAARSVSVQLPQKGTLRVAFRPSVRGGGVASAMGSVALANVQLERVEEPSAAVLYQRTGAALEEPIASCNPQSAQRFRELFVKGCESDGRCYWELATPFRIPVTLLSRADLPEGAPNRTRYNHRLGQLALNVVGSGVRDCEGVADYGTCASAQTVEYTLDHLAEGAQLYGLESNAFAAGPFPFSFGVASLSGRAVAAERNFTYLSTADRSIAFAAGAGKSDFDGRPLDANTTFRLRIWDSPELRWDRVDDIQVLLTYRYWSKLRGNSW